MQPKTKPLSEQVALVTGGGTGIGRAFTESLADAGARVLIASRREDVLHRTAGEINHRLGSERVFAYVLDIRVPAQIEELVKTIVERWQTIDLLINNAGLALPETVDKITEDGWDKVLETNLRGVMQLVRCILPLMIENDFGEIVNVASQAGKHGYADVPSYCASKFGLLGYAEALRDHVRKLDANIRIFNFCPGLVDVEEPALDMKPRPGFIHISNIARTLMYALSLDREVVLEDVNIYAR